MSHRDIIRDIGDLENRIGGAYRAVAAGALVDLTPLVGAIDDLCRRVAAEQGPEAGGEVHRRVLGLLKQVEELVHGLKGELAALEQTLAQNRGRALAVEAYSRPLH